MKKLNLNVSALQNREVLKRNELKKVLGGSGSGASGCSECSSTKGCEEGYDCDHTYDPACPDGQKYACVKKKWECNVNCVS